MKTRHNIYIFWKLILLLNRNLSGVERNVPLVWNDVIRFWSAIKNSHGGDLLPLTPKPTQCATPNYVTLLRENKVASEGFGTVTLMNELESM
jgi:hypothetical protein